MSPVIVVILALFAAYVVASAWAARVAVTRSDPYERQRAAMRFLIIASLGVPILVMLILVAL